MEQAQPCNQKQREVFARLLGEAKKPRSEALESEDEVNRRIEFEPTLTSEEAAALLQIHPKTLQRMARRRRIPAHRIGDLWRFRASELDAWLRSELVNSVRHSCRE